LTDASPTPQIRKAEKKWQHYLKIGKHFCTLRDNRRQRAALLCRLTRGIQFCKETLKKRNPTGKKTYFKTTEPYSAAAAEPLIGFHQWKTKQEQWASIDAVLSQLIECHRAVAAIGKLEPHVVTNKKTTTA
jgi:hypothetical protein